MIRRRLSLWVAAAVAACVLTAGGAWAQEPFPHDDLNTSLSADFQAMNILSSRLSKPEEVGKLVDILAARDTKAFNVWLDGLDVPVLDKCWWVQDKLEIAFQDRHRERVCRLRAPLTWAEILLYFRIQDEHRKAGTLPPIGVDGKVPPGPFLADLAANNLVFCSWELAVTEYLRPVLGPPYQFCGVPK